MADTTTTMMLCETILLAALGYEFAPLWANVVLAIWLWCFGANAGSFMNVVVYRVPRGLSVVHPGSRCPRCERPIRWFDNIPVLSWILLGARCRWCRAPISLRYPLVESFVAVVFLAVGFLSPIALDRYDFRGVSSSLDILVPWAMYGYQMLLLCTLICAALIRFDGLRPPLRLFLPAMLIGVVLPQLPPSSLWMAVRPLPFDARVDLPASTIILLDTMTGIAVGTMIGLVVWRVSRRTGSRSPATSETVVMLVVGLMLGWQGACLTAIVAAGMQLLVSLLARLWHPTTRWSWTSNVAVGAVTFILIWPEIEWRAPYMAGEASIAWFGAASILIATLAWLAAIVRPAPPPRPRVDSESLDSGPVRK